EGAPLLALEAVGGDMGETRALAVEEADPAARAPDERGDRAADAVEHRRQVEAGGDELARRVERRQLVRPPAPFLVQPALLDRRGEWARQLGQDFGVGRVEGAGASRGERHRTEDA